MAIPGSRLTVIEWFVVAVLLGAVGAAVVWQQGRSRERQHLETVKDDLRNLITAQEGYAADNGGQFMPRNSRVTTTMQYYGYAPSGGVTVDIAEPGISGWSATATHANVPGSICGIYVGDSPPAPPHPATTSGEPACN